MFAFTDPTLTYCFAGLIYIFRNSQHIYDPHQYNLGDIVQTDSIKEQNNVSNITQRAGMYLATIKREGVSFSKTCFI